MDFTEAIMEIRKASRENRLVIFVGAGVSANSGGKVWWKVIDELAKDLGHPVSRKDLTEGEELIQTTEFLRLQDRENHYENYYGSLRKIFDEIDTPNAIDQLIFDLKPMHIVTTNYDTLLENTDHYLRQEYKVIREDRDFLIGSNDRCIIKIHGDVSKIEDIVLSNSDYSEYELNRPLISNFIRSLFFNHLVLFLGYSLTDPDIRNIVGWINHYRRKYGIQSEDIQNSYLISVKPITDKSYDILKSQYIKAVDISGIPKELVEARSEGSGLDQDLGKLLYSFLQEVLTPEIQSSLVSFDKVIEDRIRILQGYNYISRCDFMQAVFGEQLACERAVMISDKKNKDRYEEFVKKMEDDSDLDLQEFVRKSRVQVVADSGSPVLKFEDCNHGCLEKYMYYAINNEYGKIDSLLDYETSKDIKIYFQLLAGNFSFSNVHAGEEHKDLFGSSYSNPVQKVLHMIRIGDLHKAKELIGMYRKQYPVGFEFLDKVFVNHYEFAEYVRKYQQASFYRFFVSPGSSMFPEYLEFDTPSDNEINKVRHEVYDLYFFFKGNFLPIDGTKYLNDEMKEFTSVLNGVFTDYIQMLLYSNSGAKIKPINTVPVIDRRAVPFKAVDVDILVKELSHESLMLALRDLSVARIETELSTSQILNKYANLVRSYSYIFRTDWIRFVSNFNEFLILAGDERLLKRSFDILNEQLKREPDWKTISNSRILQRSVQKIMGILGISGLTEEDDLETAGEKDNESEILNEFLNEAGKKSDND